MQSAQNTTNNPAPQSTAMRRPIALLGGTFDPFHKGHLTLAQALCASLDVEQVRLILCARPAFKTQVATSPWHRLRMLRLIENDYSWLKVDDIGYYRAGTSYMYHRLVTLRTLFPNTPFYYAIGADQFAHFYKWYNWKNILQYAHLVVVSRLGYPQVVPLLLRHWFLENCLPNARLLSGLAGNVCMHILRIPPISSTQVRSCLQNQQPISHLVPNRIACYIKEYGLYSPSSLTAPPTLS